MTTREIAGAYRLKQWSQALRERSANGESIKDFCARKGVSKNTFFYRQRKLRALVADTLISQSEELSRKLVPSGTVTGVKAGKAKIQVALYNGITAAATVEVVAAPTAVKIKNGSKVLAEGETVAITRAASDVKLQLTANPALTSGLTWTSSDATIATVSTAGLVTAKKNGTATITLTAYNGKKATCKVAVTQVYTVTFNANGGTIGTATTAAKTVTYAAKYVLPANPTRTGYTFNGWYTAKTGGTKITTSTVVKITANQTLYAQWTAVEVVLTYVWPTASMNITCAYGFRKITDPVLHSFHTGIDITSAYGTAIKSMSDGKVLDTSLNIRDVGKRLIIQDSKGYCAVYYHLSEFSVKVNETVTQSQTVGKSGDGNGQYAAHLHVTVRRTYELTGKTNINPLPYFNTHDKRYDSENPNNNPNPVFIKSNSKWVFNKDFDWSYKDTWWTGSDVNLPKGTTTYDICY